MQAQVAEYSGYAGPFRCFLERRFQPKSEVEQVVHVLLLVLENSRYLTVTRIERSSAGRFRPCFDAGSRQIEHEHDSLTSESGFKDSLFQFGLF
jgi:hypothetical protein